MTSFPTDESIDIFLLGMRFGDAVVAMADIGIDLRCVRRDDKPGIVTADWRDDRWNVWVLSAYNGQPGMDTVITKVIGRG